MTWIAADNRAAFATLHEVLVSVCRLLAPLSPFVTDWIHRELTGESVHLAPFVAERSEPVDAALDVAMSAIRKLARLGRAAREEVAIKVRQPLSRMVCVAPNVDDAVLSQLSVPARGGAQREAGRVRDVRRRARDVGSETELPFAG